MLGRFIKLADKWLPPPLNARYQRALGRKQFASYPHQSILAQNAQLKGQGRGKVAFLLATGPSIKQEELAKLAGQDCFSVSNFYLHHDIAVIAPKFHFFAPYHQPLILENYIAWLKEADSKLPAATNIVLGHKTYELVKEYHLFPNRKVYYLYLAEHPSCDDVDITSPVLGPQTVPIMVLPLLIYLGYRQICLLGCDHNVLKNYQGSVEHFYPNAQDMRQNSSDKNSWGNITSAIQSTLNLFQQYEFYKKILRSTGEQTEIINLSTGSWLNIFPADRLENVL